MAIFPAALLIRTHAVTSLTISYLLLTNPQLVLSSTAIWIVGESMHVRAASFASAPGTAGALSAPRPGSKDAGSAIFNKVLSSSTTEKQSVSEVLALLALVLALSAMTQFVSAGSLSVPTTFSSSTSPAAAVKNIKGKKPASSLSGGAKAKPEAVTHQALELHVLRASQSQWLTLSFFRIMILGLLVGYIYMFEAKGKFSAASSSSSFSGSTAGSNTVFRLLANNVTFTLALTDMLFWGYLWSALREEAREVLRTLGRLSGDVEAEE